MTGGLPDDTPELPVLPKVKGHELLGGPQMIQLRCVLHLQLACRMIGILAPHNSLPATAVLDPGTVSHSGQTIGYISNAATAYFPVGPSLHNSNEPNSISIQLVVPLRIVESLILVLNRCHSLLPSTTTASPECEAAQEALLRAAF